MSSCRQVFDITSNAKVNLLREGVLFEGFAQSEDLNGRRGFDTIESRHCRYQSLVLFDDNFEKSSKVLILIQLISHFK